ncbi:MAG TPA: HAMP domain-containing sensor histidine kinase [Gaiellaceae bacterium]|nr:HAMP domain-containing sensor histidine kinase [Gaiellaceae bacterium]
MTPTLDDARLAVVVHEVRSPVAALSALSKAAVGGAGDPDALPELLRLAIAAAGAIERIVMDAAVASIRAESLDIRLLVRDVVASHWMSRADVVADVDEELVVSGDPVRLRQALDNLVVNAVAYGGPGRVTVRAAAAGRLIRISVSDSGPGVPASRRDDIFEAGTRLESEVPGSGLGLALARSIAEAHGGSLELDTASMTGATFTLTLPASATHPDTAASSS